MMSGRRWSWKILQAWRQKLPAGKMMTDIFKSISKSIFKKPLASWTQPEKTAAGLAVLLFLVWVPFMGLSIASSAVVIEVDGQVIRTVTLQDTVGEVLAEQGIVLGERDGVIPGRDSTFRDGQAIQVHRAFPVTIVVDGKEIATSTCPQPVREVLQQAGVQLGPLDRAEPGLDAVVTSPGVIQVVRVEEKIVKEKKEIPAPVERQVDYTLERGIQRTVQRGQNGLALETLRILLENGRQVACEVLDVEVIKQPVKWVVAAGALTSISRGGMRIDFERAIPMRATAYTYTGSRTSTGQVPRVGGVAVDPGVIPYGTRMYVEGYGFATAIDCGKAIKGNRIDVFFETERECRRWGVKNVKVYILD